ncbi:MAG: proline dehydrogenase family protein [Pseudomonadota bacterium]
MLNRLLANLLPWLPKKLVWQISKHYIAGETINDAVNAAKKLHAQGIMTTIDLLGEFITTLDEARANKNEYLNMIDVVRKENISGNYSLKPTFFGLLIDKEAAYGYIREIVAKAAEFDHFVRIDMESADCTDMEIELFRRLKTEFPKNVGLVLQAYLKRTPQDINHLLDLNSKDIPLNIRLCKGIYVESPAIAFQSYSQINTHFLENIELMIQKKIFSAIATHDQPIVEGVYNLLDQYKVPKDRYEFQMLYGVTPKLCASILEKNHPMRVYIPFGQQWFGYCSRRIKENPKISSVIVKAIFFRG